MNQEPSFPDLILASQSTARQALLDRLQLPYSTIPADIDESVLDSEGPAQLVKRLSQSKARLVGLKHPAAWIIGSDQVAVHRNQILGKPGSLAGAKRDLALFSGETVEFLTGVALHRQTCGSSWYTMDRTVVKFRQLAIDEISRYVAIDNPVSCAGSFKVESLGPALFENVVSSDPTALCGLPLIDLCGLLRKAGFIVP